MKHTDTLPDLYTIWDYNDLNATRERFLQILSEVEQRADKDYVLQLKTQIARTYSIQSDFDNAHRILDEVEARLSDDLPVVKVRYWLERGRTFNSAEKKETALPLFKQAYELAKELGADFYTIDAAHMIAIVLPEQTEKEKWNLIGVEIAEQSQDERARGWLGSLYNNLGWDFFEQKRYAEALERFEKALDYQREIGNPERINIALWCVAKGYRHVDRLDEALEIQKALLKEYEQSGTPDGYVFEELGELYLLKNEPEKSHVFFARAYTELSKDSWLVKNESERLTRLQKLAGQDS